MPQRVEGNIEIEAPVETVYSYWETLENLPQFMANVQEVTPTGPDTTHWRVKGPFGKTLEWEAQTTQKEHNSAIAWNTTEGEVGTSGQVRFLEAGQPGRTRVEVQMNYSEAPGGNHGPERRGGVPHLRGGPLSPGGRHTLALGAPPASSPERGPKRREEGQEPHHLGV